jgi:peroxiredoxin
MVTTAPAPASGVRANGLASGQRAPELDLPATPDGRRIKLADHQDCPVVLVFYPGDFTPVCTSELGLFNELLPELGGMGAKVFGISCDSIWAHFAYARELNLQLPLLSDFHPKGEASRRYQVYRDDIGTCERALVAIDGRGVILWTEVAPLEVNPGADGVIEVLEHMTGKSLDFSSEFLRPGATS